MHLQWFEYQYFNTGYKSNLVLNLCLQSECNGHSVCSICDVIKQNELELVDSDFKWSPTKLFPTVFVTIQLLMPTHTRFVLIREKKIEFDRFSLILLDRIKIIRRWPVPGPVPLVNILAELELFSDGCWEAYDREIHSIAYLLSFTKEGFKEKTLRPSSRRQTKVLQI